MNTLTVLRAARLVGTGAPPSDDVTAVLDGGMICAAGGPVPDGATVGEAAADMLVSGVVDACVHLGLCVGGIVARPVVLVGQP